MEVNIISLTARILTDITKNTSLEKSIGKRVEKGEPNESGFIDPVESQDLLHALALRKTAGTAQVLTKFQAWPRRRLQTTLQGQSSK